FSLTWVGQRLPFTATPKGMTSSHLLGLAAVAGIGFTVSLFITGLAFDDGGIIDEAKIGILFASLIAGLVGYAMLSRASRRDVRVAPPAPVDESSAV
ncbi:MAG: Na+/H+ antiporter NhaA, partial [Acidimicrobiales bacterium]